ncbi:MAG: tetraacyldisaccharide 4'-kinase [Planctomycetota bacterium]
MRDAYLALIRGQRRGAVAGLAKLGLRTIAIPYGWGVRLRNLAFDRGWKASVQADVPVVSVGNLTLGGTGKTPCVEYLARWFRERGVQVAILSRGYGAEQGPNDEALVLEENCPDVPHLQGSDRAALAKTAVEELESELLILDDGFQHRRLRRDLDLVLIDATCPWGHGYLFPRGLLRESSTSLRRAHAVLITRCGAATPEAVQAVRRDIEQAAPGLAIIESDHQPAAWVNSAQEQKPANAFHGQAVAGFCGLGNPDAFRRTLTDLGCDVTAWRTFPDHYAYARSDIEDLRAWARALPAGAIVATTQKDLVKIRLDRIGERELWALKIELAIRSGQEALDRLLEKTLGAATDV